MSDTEYHDEQTLEKVKGAIGRVLDNTVVVSTEDLTDYLIMEMLKAGILFREKTPEKKPEPQMLHRDADSGEFVTEEYAKDNPKTTVKETTE